MTKIKFANNKLQWFHVYRLWYICVNSLPFVAISCESLRFAIQIGTFRSDFQFSNLNSAARRKDGLEVLLYDLRRCSTTEQQLKGFK